MTAGPLTPLQIQVTRLFFSLPVSAGFAVAGGAGLIARGLISRPTQDVNLFLLDTRLSTVASAAAAFETAMDRQGWSHTRVLDQQEFIRLSVADGQDTLILDLGRDSPAAEATDSTELGPTLSPRDLAARKTLALFGRAEPRDFTDVHALAQRYGRDRLLRWAAEDDPGSTRTSSPPCSPPSTASPTPTFPSAAGRRARCALSCTTGQPHCNHALPTPPPEPRHSETQLDKTQNTNDPAAQHPGALSWPRSACGPDGPMGRERDAIEPALSGHLPADLRRSRQVRQPDWARSPEPCAQVRILLGAQLNRVISN